MVMDGWIMSKNLLLHKKCIFFFFLVLSQFEIAQQLNICEVFKMAFEVEFEAQMRWQWEMKLFH